MAGFLRSAAGFGLLAALAGLGAPACAAPRAMMGGPEIAITIDDVPVHGPLPAGQTRLGVARTILAALKAAGVAEAYGFVNGGFTEAEPGSDSVFSAWREAGFPLGNHTWSHGNLDAGTAADYEATIARNEPLLARLAGAGAGARDWHWFRFPFLAEGADPAKRSEIRRFLAARHYRIAAVTMSFGDYAWNEPYARCVAKGDSAAIAQLEAGYLDAARDSMRDSRNLARALYGRDIPYVLLLHIGAFDARMLPRLLALYRDAGVTFVPLAKAERDPFYARDVDPSQPAGPSGLAAQAAARGLPLPPPSPQMAALDSFCR